MDPDVTFEEARQQSVGAYSSDYRQGGSSSAPMHGTM
jgi:hypothetical protein